MEKASVHGKDHRECSPCGMVRILQVEVGERLAEWKISMSKVQNVAGGCLLTNNNLSCASFKGKQEASLAGAYELCMIYVCNSKKFEKAGQGSPTDRRASGTELAGSPWVGRHWGNDESMNQGKLGFKNLRQ